MSLVVRPHPEDFDDSFLIEDLVDKTVLNADPARIRPGEIANELLEGRWRLPRIPSEDVDQLFRSRTKARTGDPARVLLRLSCEDNGPAYHPGWPEHSSAGVAIPSRIDSRIPGTDRRNSVS